MIKRDFVRFGMALACVAASGTPLAADGPGVCVPIGQWTVPDGRAPVVHDRLIDTVAAKSVVLLGESHTNAEDHRWQLQMIAALHGRTPNMVLGFEAFPRRVQGVLDRWGAGKLDETGFLEAVEWKEIWGVDPGLYMPLFHFARMNRIPMVALNVERSLVSKVGKAGWDAVPLAEREGVDDPAKPLPAYRDRLREIFSRHHGNRDSNADNDPGLNRFVAAQLTWDRAMAQAIAKATEHRSASLVVGVVGRGHLEYSHGVPWQLSDLGINDVAVLLTWTSGRNCAELIGSNAEPVADAVFGIAETPDPDESS